ncbi:S41 family peptidase [Aneurinibacillus sp. Ricciae_BoGa-3]|uniref:S41 family peptidase n=1 Tax=Aneurinibacillus sp. Ricciae_BoGa-3 TaxID=3022697 RepID=UPI00233FB76D|nr:S41 family peptidase [Aneurinibacillus sp. Ricciae_BoGa-3]WCK54218.1 S41 family peptidase [Aneurinibacillus sp. Ricciae_BoGa-3]
MKKSIQRLMMAGVVISAFFQPCTGVFAAASVPSDTTYKQQEARIDEVLRKLMEQHLNSKLDISKLTDAAIRGMVSGVGDPYTDYYTDNEFNTFMDGIQGTYTGIGVYLQKAGERLLVYSVIDKTPAGEAGIMVGDEILSVNGENIETLLVDQAADKLAGTPGRVLDIKVKRNNRIINFHVSVAAIQAAPLDSLMLDNGIGYINLYTFSDQSPVILRQQLSALNDRGMKGLILDLRDNPGGYVQAAVDIAGMFIGKGTAVNIVDRTGSKQAVAVNGTKWQKPMIVLVNNGTASAAEILTAALQDYGVAKVMGTQTYGKGVIQQVQPLNGGGVLKLTVAEYYSPLMHKINLQGIRPDIAVQGTDNQILQAIKSLNGAVSLNLMADGSATLSGYPVAEKTLVQRIGNGWFVALRSFADTFNGSISWDGRKGQVTFQSGNTKKSYFLNNPDIRSINGTTYLSVDRLHKDFPSIIVQKQPDRTVIRPGA